MIRYLKVTAVCCLLVSSTCAIQLPPSPCPNVFAYEGDAEPDRWHGVITFSSNIELVGMNYKVQLDRPSQLLVSWDGEVRSDDNINYNVFDPFHTQRGGEVVKARIMVKYNPNNGIPGIMRIVINGNTMCSKDGNFGAGFGGIGLSGGESSTERFDPAFSENEDVASEFANNRGQSNGGNYGGGSNYNNENLPNYENRPNSNSNRPSYVGGGNEPNYSGSNSPNYNQQQQQQHQNNGGSGSNSNSNRYSPPNYSNSGATGSSVFVVNPSNNAGGSSSGSYVPSNGGSGGGGSGGNFNGNSASYPTSNSNSNNNNYNTDYNTNNRPQWPSSSSSSSDTLSSSGYNNNNNNRSSSWQTNGFSNSQTSTAGSESGLNGGGAIGPIVTTLTLPNAGIQNKTNIDQIVQIIKNQLEQQQISPASNKTVIVAVVNPVPSNMAAQFNANATSAISTEPPIVYRTTTTPTTTITSRAKIVVSTATKSSSTNGHTSRPKD